MKPEVLDGDNKYNCSNCNKKCKAEKGLKIEKLPEILSFIISRFDFDFI